MVIEGEVALRARSRIVKAEEHVVECCGHAEERCEEAYAGEGTGVYVQWGTAPTSHAEEARVKAIKAESKTLLNSNGWGDEESSVGDASIPDLVEYFVDADGTTDEEVTDLLFKVYSSDEDESIPELIERINLPSPQEATVEADKPEEESIPEW